VHACASLAVKQPAVFSRWLSIRRWQFSLPVFSTDGDCRGSGVAEQSFAAFRADSERYKGRAVQSATWLYKTTRSWSKSFLCFLLSTDHYQSWSSSLSSCCAHHRHVFERRCIPSISGNTNCRVKVGERWKFLAVFWHTSPSYEDVTSWRLLVDSYPRTLHSPTLCRSNTSDVVYWAKGTLDWTCYYWLLLHIYIVILKQRLMEVLVILCIYAEISSLRHPCKM